MECSISFELHEPNSHCYLRLLTKVNKFKQNNHLPQLVHVAILVQASNYKMESWRMSWIILNLFYSSNAFKTNLLECGTNENGVLNSGDRHGNGHENKNRSGKLGNNTLKFHKSKTVDSINAFVFEKFLGFSFRLKFRF